MDPYHTDDYYDDTADEVNNFEAGGEIEDFDLVGISADRR